MYLWYKGHVVLLVILLSILLIAHVISQNKRKFFAYTCFLISITFFLISLRYYFDVFIFNPTSEGYAITWSMYLLTQNEDFLHINGKYYGLYWGIGITLISFFLAIISLNLKNRFTDKYKS